MAPAKHGLGRGLGALIPPGVPPALVPGVREIEVARISPNPRQPRHRMDPDALRELSVSIKEHGLIQPLIVTPAPDSTDLAPRYQLIAGERRWSAAKLAGLERVPVFSAPGLACSVTSNSYGVIKPSTEPALAPLT